MSNLNQMSINRHEKRKLQTRIRIMRAAVNLFLAKGYDNVSISEIADMADIGRATFYLHFNDKIDMCIAIINQNSQFIIDRVGEEVQHMTMRERSYYSWLRMYESIETQTQHYFSLMGRDFLEILQRNLEYTVALYVENLEHGKYDLEVDLPNEFVGNFLAAAIQQVTGWWMMSGFEYTPKQMAEMTYKILYRESPPFIESAKPDTQ